MPVAYRNLTSRVEVKDECDAALVLAAVRKSSVPAIVRIRNGKIEIIVHIHHEPQLLDAALFVLTSRS